MLSSKRNVHFQPGRCSRRSETFTFSLGGALVEAKREFRVVPHMAHYPTGGPEIVKMNTRNLIGKTSLLELFWGIFLAIVGGTPPEAPTPALG